MFHKHIDHAMLQHLELANWLTKLLSLLTVLNGIFV